MTIGLSYYGIMHDLWPVKDSMDAFETCPNAAMSILWNTFGTNLAGLQTWKDLKKRHILEVHLLNGPGLRNKRLGKYEVLHGYTSETFDKALTGKEPKLTKRLNSYFRDAARTLGQILPPDTELYISPDLESDLSHPAFHNLTSLVRPHFDPLGARYVWNPNGANEHNMYISGFYYELHGSRDKLNWIDIYNLDGEDIDFKERPAVIRPAVSEERLLSWLRERSESRCNFLWIAEFNALLPGRFIDPRKRTHFPTRQTFQLVRRYL